MLKLKERPEKAGREKRQVLLLLLVMIARCFTGCYGGENDGKLVMIARCFTGCYGGEDNGWLGLSDPSPVNGGPLRLMG